MIVQTTRSGSKYVEFSDATGCECALQDGEMATESCIWLGVRRMPDEMASPAVCMHLTVEMARRVARAMRDALEGEQVEPFDFEDRSGSCCVFTAGDDRIRLGVVRSFTRGPARAMVLDHTMARGIMPLLLGFLAQGSIGGDGGASVLDDERRKQRPVLLPAAVMDRTDVGETGVTVGEIVDAFLRLHRHVRTDGDVRMDRMAQRLTALRSRKS